MGVTKKEKVSTCPPSLFKTQFGEVSNHHLHGQNIFMVMDQLIPILTIKTRVTFNGA